MSDSVGESNAFLTQQQKIELQAHTIALKNEEDNIQDPMSFSSIAEQAENKERKIISKVLSYPHILIKGK